MNPLRGRFEFEELLTRLGVAPQFDCQPHEAPLLGSAVFLDQLVDADAPFRRFMSIDRHRTERSPGDRDALSPIEQRRRAKTGTVIRMNPARQKSEAATPQHPAATSRDHDVHKGATEDGRTSDATNAPGLDAEGLPNDTMLIAAHAVAARVDGCQG